MNDPNPLAIIDTPNTHGMFMLGTTTLYLCHMPMFTKEDHYYQVTLQARLDPTSMKAYLADRASHPGEAYNLINPDSDSFILPDVANGTITSFPATVYRGYSNEGGGTPGPAILSNATVLVDRVIRYRAFDQDVPRPEHLTYVLFGDGAEAHLDHYIARDPDFQHLLTLPEVPTWLSKSQLRAGVEVSFVDLKSEPIGCESPLREGVYPVMFQGRPESAVPLRVGPRSTIWYSTGNMLNAVDPCGGAGGHAGMKMP
jgi:hypothetical protein